MEVVYGGHGGLAVFGAVLVAVDRHF